MSKGMRVLLTVLAVIMAVMSLLLLIVSPVAGVIGIVFAVLLFFYTRKTKKADEAAEAESQRRIAYMYAQQKAMETAKPRFYVVGIGYRSEGLDSLLPDAAGYARPSNRSRRYYKYDVYEGPCTLDPEPDNPADPNAVKVVVNKAWHIGYIKREQTAEAKQLISEGKRFFIKITGGPYKYFDEVSGKWMKEDGKFYADVLVEGE